MKNKNILYILLILFGFVPFVVFQNNVLLIIPFFVVLAILFYGVVFISSNLFVKTICQGPSNNKEIALTFDDGPDSLYTIKVLDILDEYNIKAGFFCIGERIEKNKEILSEIHKRGHVIGNHTFTHSNFYNFYTKNMIGNDLMKTHKLIKDITGKDIKYFRPSNGLTNITLAKALKITEYTVIGWSIRPFDTVLRNPVIALRLLCRSLRPGRIVLLHDTNKNIETILRRYIEYVIENGYKIVPLDKLVGVKAYEE